jgi:hypothetical protein
MGQVSLRSRGPGVETSAAVALSALAEWKWAVQGSLSASPTAQARTALRGLVAWYEGICNDNTCHIPAPTDGLEARIGLERGPDGLLTRRIVVSHWAVRVAQELAEFHRREIECDGEFR